MNKFIKNKGITETIIRKDNQDHHTKIKWNANYDGKLANLKMVSNTDGKVEKFDVKLDNDDLAELLNVQTVNMPLHKRLNQDFMGQRPRCMANDQMMYKIELEAPRPEPIPYLSTPELSSLSESLSESLIPDVKSHISSPMSNEEILIPLALQKAAYTLTPKRRHRRRKTHITHRAYKKYKSRSSKRSDKKRSSSRKRSDSSKRSSSRKRSSSSKKHSSRLRSL